MGIFQKLVGNITSASPSKNSGPSHPVSNQHGTQGGNLNSDADPAHQQKLRTEQEFRNDDPTTAFNSNRNYKNSEFQHDISGPGAGGKDAYGGKELISGAGPGMTAAAKHSGPTMGEYDARENLGTGATGAQAGTHQYRRASDAGPGSGFGGGMGMGPGTGDTAKRHPVKHATMPTPQSTATRENQYESDNQQLFPLPPERSIEEREMVQGHGLGATQQRHIQPIIEEKDSDVNKNGPGIQKDQDKGLNETRMLQSQNQTQSPRSMGMGDDSGDAYAQNQALNSDQMQKPKDTIEHADPEHVSIDKGESVNERQHHHVHHIVQPVIHKETIEPHRVHTTIPIHHVTHEAPVVHRSQAHEPVSMEEFLAKGGGATGGMGKDQVRDTVLRGGECTRDVQGGETQRGSQSQFPHEHHRPHGSRSSGDAFGITPEMNCKVGEGMFMGWETTPSADRSRDLSHPRSTTSEYGSSHTQPESTSYPKLGVMDSHAHPRTQAPMQDGRCSGDKYAAPGEGIFTDPSVHGQSTQMDLGRRGAQSGYGNSSTGMPPHTHTRDGEGMFKDSREYQARDEMGYGTGRHVDFKNSAADGEGGVGSSEDEVMLRSGAEGTDARSPGQMSLRGKPEQHHGGGSMAHSRMKGANIGGGTRDRRADGKWDKGSGGWETQNVGGGNASDKMDLASTGDSGLMMPGSLDAGNPSSYR